MGSILEPSVKPVSGVSGSQQTVQSTVSNTLLGLISDEGIYAGRSEALADILAGSPTDITGIEEAMRRRFHRETVPDINAAFADVGGTLSSRRGETVARAGVDLDTRIGQIQAGLTESARNRQLQGVSLALSPLTLGAQFSTQRTIDNIAEPSLFGQFLGLGGTLGSAALLGKGGGG